MPVPAMATDKKGASERSPLLGGPSPARPSSPSGKGYQRMEHWEIPALGGYKVTLDVDAAGLRAAGGAVRERVDTGHKLGELEATAICGNDILSSCLYVASQVTESAGMFAPVCLALVAGILWLYKGIYGESITAISMNGGSYNVLINTTSKPVAATAACLAVISYIATGVVSATTAISYLQVLVPDLPLITGVVVLHAFFALLNAWGIGESARVAMLIFVLHLFTLSLFVLLGLVFVVGAQGGHLWANLAAPLPAVEITSLIIPGNMLTALFFGTCTGMLGVSGFESSSQFVEEQAPGVFVKTLRNMWLGVAFFNPVISLISLCVLPMTDVKKAKGNLLAVVTQKAGNWLQDALSSIAGIPRVSNSRTTLGGVLQFFVCVDAFVVLCGAVLTGYVGINGLACRMASDGVLPEFLLHKNRWRGTTHNTTLVFFLLSASQVIMLHGDVSGLSGVYTFAFLGVMTCFGVGTIMLKFKRPSLPREVHITYAHASLGVICVLATFLGNLMGKSDYVSYFSFYLCGVGIVIVIMFQRVRLMKLLYLVLRSLFPRSSFAGLKNIISELRSGPMIFFAKHADLYVLNKAVLYMRDNEQTNELIFAHVTPLRDGKQGTFAWLTGFSLDASAEDLLENVDADTLREDVSKMEIAARMLDEMYPKLKISFLCVQGATWGADVVEWIAMKTGIDKNKMMIACPDAAVPDKLVAFGGIRIVTH
uniref:Amino acid permease/ SLC12A domain-containing protein n=1 Tax=Phaeomonas parva TaxID=124430 RepID=A0A7S1UN14_9STRA|mmetsp:Transcript_9955/g.29283  ORF Transcript_9955/g.29283 Transcript_9955/m.29283 type:complete len:711 (+) Transcript_9955:175-2307(+)